MSESSQKKRNWYDKSYKFLLVISLIVVIGAVAYLWNFNATTGDIILKDVSLTGGTSVTVFDSGTNIEDLRETLEENFEDVVIRGVSDVRTGGQKGFIVETGAEPDEIKGALEDYLGYELTSENSSTEFTGSSLSEGFYEQLRFAILIAFIFMAVVVFIIFRSFVPSIAVILAAFADIVLTIAVVDLMGMHLSIAGVVAFLMLIGYSVDTDILMTSRVLKHREGSVNARLFDSFKTGATMTVTSIIAIAVALFVVYSVSDTLRQIFTVLLIGLGFDLFMTWFANAGILKWYAEKKEAKA